MLHSIQYNVNITIYRIYSYEKAYFMLCFSRRATVVMKVKKDATEHGLKKTWRILSDTEQTLIRYLAYAPPPVSIDMLSSLVKVSAVTIVNAMEKLKRSGFVRESRQYGKGLYFLKPQAGMRFAQETMPNEQREGILRDLLVYYTGALDEGDEKTLILAEIYYQLGDKGQGLTFIQRGADLLYHQGKKDKAAIYYGYLLNNLSESELRADNVAQFIDSTIERLSLAGREVPLAEQIAILTRTHEIAQGFGRWDSLARIKLDLIRILKEAGEHEKVSEHFNDILNLAERIGDQGVLRKTVLSVIDFLLREGRIGEAVDRYEKTVGNLEEFGDGEAELTTSALLAWSYVVCGRVSRGMGMIDAVRSKAISLNLQGVAVYTDLVAGLCSLEIRKPAQAQQYLEEVLSRARDEQHHDALRAALSSMACIHLARDEYERACERLEEAHRYPRGHDFLYYSGSHLLESLYELKKRGFDHNEINYESEIELMLNQDNVYLKGIALRMRAVQNIRNRQARGRAFLDLRASEKNLFMAGAEIELARTRIALGDAYLQEGEINVALNYLNHAWELFSKVDKGLFPKDLLVIMMPQEEKTEFVLDRIVDINESLGTIRDIASFLERVINMTMDFTMAMRGAFFLVGDEDEPRIAASRNLDPLMLKAEQFNFIRELVRKVTRSSTELIMPEPLGAATAEANLPDTRGISSFLCMPAKLGDHVYGCLYLDNSLDEKPFPHGQLPYVRLLCSQIAVGLSNIKLYEEMKGLKDRFEEEAIFYKQAMGITVPTEKIIGRSESMLRILNQVRQIAPTDSSVLITGETGVGKELVAKAIHNLGKRSHGPFIPVNLAALPQDLVASELFGHEKGAFTGAHERQKGRFELAHGGTIFLDEIGDLPLGVQVKLLRVLQEGTFERLGSSKSIRSDFRVIAATNRDLEKEVEKGSFRRDLYYRLNVIPIDIPPLKDRREDILELAEHFIDTFSKKMGKKIGKLSADASRTLMEYSWPGNVRELEHFIERAVILSQGPRIDVSHLHRPSARKNEDRTWGSLAEMEREHIERILNATHWKVSGPNGAAAILQLKPTTLISRMKKLGIKKPPVTKFLTA